MRTTQRKKPDGARDSIETALTQYGNILRAASERVTGLLNGAEVQRGNHRQIRTVYDRIASDVALAASHTNEIIRHSSIMATEQDSVNARINNLGAIHVGMICPGKRVAAHCEGEPKE